MAGGDWQDPIQFDIVVWDDTLAAINIKFVDEWQEGLDREEVLTKLGLEVQDESDED